MEVSNEEPAKLPNFSRAFPYQNRAGRGGL